MIPPYRFTTVKNVTTAHTFPLKMADISAKTSLLIKPKGVMFLRKHLSSQLPTLLSKHIWRKWSLYLGHLAKTNSRTLGPFLSFRECWIFALISAYKICYLNNPCIVSRHSNLEKTRIRGKCLIFDVLEATGMTTLKEEESNTGIFSQ